MISHKIKIALLSLLLFSNVSTKCMEEEPTEGEIIDFKKLNDENEKELTELLKARKKGNVDFSGKVLRISENSGEKAGNSLLEKYNVLKAIGKQWFPEDQKTKGMKRVEVTAN